MSRRCARPAWPSSMPLTAQPTTAAGPPEGYNCDCAGRRGINHRLVVRIPEFVQLTWRHRHRLRAWCSWRCCAAFPGHAFHTDRVKEHLGYSARTASCSQAATSSSRVPSTELIGFGHASRSDQLRNLRVISQMPTPRTAIATILPSNSWYPPARIWLSAAGRSSTGARPRLMSSTADR